MSNARKCDICGKFYAVPEFDPGYFMDEFKNTSFIHVAELLPEERGVKHDILHFDVCEECRQDVLDYILTKKADAE